MQLALRRWGKMGKVTIICTTEDSGWDTLIYTALIPDDLLVPGSEGKSVIPTDAEEIQLMLREAVAEQRSEDLEDPDAVHESDVQILFCFPGDLHPIFDNR